MFFVAAALLTITVGVFASRPKFSTSLYAYDSNQTGTAAYHLIVTGATLSSSYSTTGTVQATIIDKNSVSFPIYETQDQLNPVYATATF